MTKDVTFQEVCDVAFQTEPDGFLRVARIQDGGIWVVHNFKNPYSACTVLGSSAKSAQDAANDFVAQGRKKLANPEQPMDDWKKHPSLARARLANENARHEMEIALAKWQEAFNG